MVCKIIGIVSFKGGVGKSVSSINLASGFQSRKKRVLVVDGNFLNPNLHLFLGLLKPKVTLKDIIKKEIAPENAIYKHKSGIDLLPCSFYRNVDFKKFKGVIDELKEKYDYIIVDSGPSYSEEVIATLMVCDELIFITTPDYPTLAATVKVNRFVKFKNIHVLGIIVNRRKGQTFELKKEDIEETVGIRVIAQIPEDIKMMKSVNAFSPVAWKYKWSSSGRIFLKLAKKLDK